MMRSIAILLMGLLLGGSHLHAQTIQNPGYLGHKTAFHLKGGFFPAFGIGYDGASRNAPDNGDRRFFMTHRYQAGISTSMSKSAALEVAAHYVPAAVRLRNIATDEVEHFFVGALGGGVGVKVFPFKRKGAIAPLGPYTGIDFILYSVTVRNGEDSSRSDFKELYGRLWTTSLAVTFGKEFIVEDKLMIGVGARYAGNGLLQALLSDNDFNSEVATRMLAYSVFNLQLSLGYLL